jgi:hypothetical protein
MFLTWCKSGCWTLAKAGLVGRSWLSPMTVADVSFDFESALASSIVQEELLGHLDSGEMGCGLFSTSPLTSPETTAPPSPAQQPTLLDGTDIPSIGSLSPPNPERMPGESSAAVCDLPGTVTKADKRYRSNKTRSHAKRTRARANERKEREAGGQPYEVRASSRLKHVHQSNALNADVSLTDMPISAPGYIGVRDTAEQKDTRDYQLGDLIGEGSRFKFQLKKWDGR